MAVDKSNLFFQYCQKIILFDEDLTQVYLARRKGEADYDNTFSFIGGKMETTDASIEASLKREKDEEIGKLAKIRICPTTSFNVLYRKKDGSVMVLPHYAAFFIGGDIKLNEEYSEGAWVKLADLSSFEPKIETIEEAVHWARNILSILDERDFSII